MVQRLNERGLSIIAVAVSLPIILVVGMSVIELFLYFRACAVVQRAAAEAGRAMVAALPGDASAYGSGTYPNTFPSVADKALVTTDRDHNLYYERSDGPDDDVVNLPFLLSTAELGPNSSTQDPGVQYLPFVTVWTCLEPQNETPHTRAGCAEFQTGFLTYQIPTKLDFDGDGAEDIAFYYGNAEDDWHVITSSSGALFRNSLRFNLGTTVTSTEVWLPAPGDYDGDGKTDPAVMRADEPTITLQIRFSTRYYEQFDYVLASGTGLSSSELHIPVVGRYNTDGSGPSDRDRFAVVLLETTTAATQPADTHFLKTLIWPAVDTSGTDPTLADSATVYSGWDKKPAPGQQWRPAFGDHDGDGYVDIGWLTWKGGNQTWHVAGDSLGTSVDGSVATDTPMIPWALYHPRDVANSPGLYVVERNSHRVLLITRGSNTFVGDHDGETVEIIAGNAAITPDTSLASPDPLSKGELDTDACTNCYAGGGDTTGTPASTSRLKHPTAVASLGASGSPLFIADFGNRKVKMITADGDNKVDGTASEAMSVIVGGGKPAAAGPCDPLTGAPPAYCGAGCNVGGGTPPADTACPWGCYGTPASIDPRCVAVRPTALEIFKDYNTGTAGNQEVLFVADERAVIFVVYQGADGVWGGGDDRLEKLAGTYNAFGTGSPTNVSFGVPTALSMRLSSNGAPLGLRVVTRSNGSSGTAGGRWGGVFQVNPGATRYPPAAPGTHAETVTALAGTWGSDPLTRPSIHAAGSGAGSIAFRNPVAVVSASFENTPSAGIGDPVLGMFLTSWLNNSGTGTPYENYLGHGYFHGVHSGAGGTTTYSMRWMNNPHLLSWGKRAPGDEPAGAFQLTRAQQLPLSTLPVEPAAGVALSPDNRFLYFSQTRRGEVFVTFLDQDGDGYANYGGRFNADCAQCSTAYEWTGPVGGQQMNSDGDDINNNNDVTAVNRDVYHFQPGANPLRTMEVYQDARMWAIGTNTTASPSGAIATPSGTNVSRLENVLDRFSAVQATTGGSATIPGVEAGPFHVLNRNTIAAPNARAAMHQTPVWSGGVSRDNETGAAGVGSYRLAPIILGDRSPVDTEIKDESGFVECDNWQMRESFADLDLGIDGTGYTGLLANGCDRVLSGALYTGSTVTVATKRVHPARWTGQGMPDMGSCASSPCPHQVGFLDRDGVSGRNPVVYATGRATADNEPLMVHIGLMNNCSDYPGQYAQASLFTKTSLIPTQFPSITLGPNDWLMNCYATEPFYTAGNTNILSIMADYHAERSNHTERDLKDTVAVTGNRTSQTGPIALTAYRILEDSLRVTQRNSVASKNHAQVTFTTNTEAGYTTAVATVRFVFPLFGPIAALYGEDTVIITRSNQRVSHQLGQNL